MKKIIFNFIIFTIITSLSHSYAHGIGPKDACIVTDTQIFASAREILLESGYKSKSDQASATAEMNNARPNIWAILKKTCNRQQKINLILTILYYHSFSTQTPYKSEDFTTFTEEKVDYRKTTIRYHGGTGPIILELHTKGPVSSKEFLL